jgi:Ca-activated chloride channel family protein
VTEEGRRSAAFLRHVPLALALLALPFFLLAFADPFTTMTQEEMSYPGRRISVMIDASASMTMPFTAEVLNKKTPTQAAFFTSVNAAERFIRLRMAGKYRDLMALVEFGNEAYVVTPFTNDYDNILLSTSLIGDMVEFTRFPDRGTTIGLAIQQSVDLFRAFNFLNAAGNLMIMFTDGEDGRTEINGQSIDKIVEQAIEAKIPLYMVRTVYNKKLGGIVPDELWKSAVEKTGGRFYAASDEETILRAIQEIDQLGAGTIQMKRYTSQRPHFAAFAIVAVGLWTAAIALRLLVPAFQKYP